ncbi:MAG: hypothetical protein PWQ37_1791 [Candidatus Petromonas sp.]|jgi:uncharacterized membrane protein YkvA (DUF1232 family)|nr:hypothetical protein [Candidatus Petromonas sp.]
MRINTDKIIKSEQFQKATSKAREYIKNPQKINKLLKDAGDKTRKLAKSKKEPVMDMLEQINILFRMLKAYYRKEYTKIPTEAIVAIIAAIVYFVSPIDFLPDFIPGFGFFDDVAVIGVVLKTIKREIEDFLLWEGKWSFHYTYSKEDDDKTEK